MGLFNYDYIIIGAGCSGLSLAVQLYQSGLLANKRLLLLDSRESYSQDKSWCGWHVFSHVFESCVSKSWRFWEVKYAGESIVHPADRYPYQYIAAHDFYNYCLDQINSCDSITLKLNTTVDKIESHYVRCGDEIFTADLIFDARSPKQDLPLNDNFLLQCFYGWHIKTNREMFDPKKITFMDFSTDQSRGINFMYILPFSTTEALIEPTYFLHHRKIPKRSHFYDLMTDYLQSTYECSQFGILRMEKGVLPMMAMQGEQKHANIISIGTSTGLLRPATGYAFYTIQRYTQQIVAALKAGKPIPNKAYSRQSQWLDEVFLRVCRRHPEQGAHLLMQMFQRNHPDTIARFMQDEANFKDILSIIKSVPKWPFIRAAIRPKQQVL